MRETTTKADKLASNRDTKIEDVLHLYLLKDCENTPSSMTYCFQFYSHSSLSSQSTNNHSIITYATMERIPGEK
jgi:hypothetical protein